MASDLNVLPGRINDLFPEQEAALKQVWAQILTVLEGYPFQLLNEVAEPDATVDGGKAQIEMWSSLKRNFVLPHIHYATSKTVFQEALGACSEEQIINYRSTMRQVFRQDHPDNIILRFLRAQKYDVTKTLQAVAFTLKWRQEQFHTLDLVRTGELEALNNHEKGLLLQYQLGKTIVYGVDRKNRPLVVIRPRFHNPRAQSERDMERYSVLMIEAIRGFLKEPMVDSAAVIFDFTKFTLANTDLAILKFLFKCIEAHYPECLGFMLIHRAPWIFNGIWNIVKKWIDPVVAAKISFTKTYEELTAFIEPKYILKELGGECDFKYEYIFPNVNENDRLKDSTRRNVLEDERNQILDAFMENTSIWIKGTGYVASEAQAQKDSWADKLRSRYWALDPYIRARNIFDRNGVMAQFQPDYIA